MLQLENVLNKVNVWRDDDVEQTECDQDNCIGMAPW